VASLNVVDCRLKLVEDVVFKSGQLIRLRVGSGALIGGGASPEAYFSASVEIRLVIIPVRYVV